MLTHSKTFRDRCRCLQDPLPVLPAPFGPLEKLLQDMPMYKPDGSKGLLYHGQFGAQSATVPDFTKEIEKIDDNKLLSGKWTTEIRRRRVTADDCEHGLPGVPIFFVDPS